MNRARWRRPKPASSLLFLAAVAVFLVAGQWQWRRADAKSAMAAALIETQAATTVRKLDEVLAGGNLSAFERVRIEGVVDTAKLILLDNQMREGQYGVRVYAPMPLDTSRTILVELGWIAADRSRQTKPVVPSVAAQIDTDALLSSVPAAGLQLGPEPWPDHPEFPLLRSRIDLDELRAHMGWNGLLDTVAVLRPDAQSAFQTEWKPPGLSADKHRGYALQWLSFALGTLVFFILWHRPRNALKS